MNKAIIEIWRAKGAIYGYDFVTNPITETDVLDKLIVWSKEKENGRKKIYKHFTKWEYENLSEDRFYTPEINKSLKIPYCDHVCYLTIYWQEV